MSFIRIKNPNSRRIFEKLENTRAKIWFA